MAATAQWTLAAYATVGSDRPLSFSQHVPERRYKSQFYVRDGGLELGSYLTCPRFNNEERLEAMYTHSCVWLQSLASESCSEIVPSLDALCIPVRRPHTGEPDNPRPKLIRVGEEESWLQWGQSQLQWRQAHPSATQEMTMGLVRFPRPRAGC